MRRVEKPWGHELIWAETPRYVGKILHIAAGQRLSRQYHVEKDETFLVQSGVMHLEIGTGAALETIVLAAGGKITALDGAPATFHAGHVAVSNGLVHDALLAALARGESADGR